MKNILSVLLCVLLLSGCAVKQENKPVETTAGKAVGHSITLYVPNEDVTGFLQIRAEVPEMEVSEIFAALAEAGVLKEEAKANSLEIQGAKLFLDVNDGFAAQLNGYGTSGEYYMMGSVVNTLLTAFQADTLFVTVNGTILETGHSIYDYDLEFYPDI